MSGGIILIICERLGSVTQHVYDARSSCRAQGDGIVVKAGI